jgi:hypothetical protein
MGFLGKLGAGLSKFGSLAQAALKPIGSIAPKAAGLVKMGADMFLPGSVAKVVGTVADKVASFVSSPSAMNIAGAIGNIGSKLAGIGAPTPQAG